MFGHVAPGVVFFHNEAYCGDGVVIMVVIMIMVVVMVMVVMVVMMMVVMMVMVW